MTQTQRIGLALFIMGLFNLSTGAGPAWFTLSIVVFGWLCFVSTNISAHFLHALFSLLFGAGWLYRRLRGIPEPNRTA